MHMSIDIRGNFVLDIDMLHIMYPDGYEALDNDNSWSETPVKSPMWDFAACSDDLYTRLWKITYVPT